MLIALETLANFLGRPFRLDFYFERTPDFARHTYPQWAFDRPAHEGDSYKLFAGPFEFHICVLPKAAVSSDQQP